jgi:hypothetical protein
MKNVGEFKEELIVMSEVKSDKTSKNKYIISGNKKDKNVSIILFLNDKVDNQLINYLDNKNININFFVERNYLINNVSKIREISKNNNIYYYGEDGKYNDKYMINDNNIINVNTNNESTYCLTKEKDSDTLKTCTDYDMKTIKATYISENIIQNIKETLSNGNIIVLDTNKLEDISISINYILSKGYNITSLDDLLNESENCN